MPSPRILNERRIAATECRQYPKLACPLPGPAGPVRGSGLGSLPRHRPRSAVASTAHRVGRTLAACWATVRPGYRISKACDGTLEPRHHSQSRQSKHSALMLSGNPQRCAQPFSSGPHQVLRATCLKISGRRPTRRTQIIEDSTLTDIRNKTGCSSRWLQLRSSSSRTWPCTLRISGDRGECVVLDRQGLCSLPCRGRNSRHSSRSYSTRSVTTRTVRRRPSPPSVADLYNRVQTGQRGSFVRSPNRSRHPMPLDDR